MGLRLIQPTMRFTLILFLLALVFSLGGPASYAAVANPALPMADSDEGCGSQLQTNCPFLCQPASALAQARQQITPKPLPSCADGGVRGGTPAVISGRTWSPVTAIGLGPPPYLNFLRLLL